MIDQAHENVSYKLSSQLLLGQGGTSNIVPSWDLSGHINDLDSKKIHVTAPQNLIAKSLGNSLLVIENWIFFICWPKEK